MLAWFHSNSQAEVKYIFYTFEVLGTLRDLKTEELGEEKQTHQGWEADNHNKSLFVTFI